jgi:hypothetical protein
MHHMLPQNDTMKAWFADPKRDLNVDDPKFLVCMPPGAHIGKGGLHPNGWNPVWAAFIRVEGEVDPLRPSIVHPFWVKRGDESTGAWIAAGHMQVGDLVQTIAGDWRRVQSITPEADTDTVYNFTVDQDHDYFVGETGFLVHNQNCGCNPVFFPRNVHPGTRSPGNPRGLFDLPASGSYSGDRQALLDAADITDGAPGWAAHHVSFTPSTGMMTMQLVDSIVHAFSLTVAAYRTTKTQRDASTLSN